MNNKTLILLTFLISLNTSFANSKKFVCDGKVEDYAKELILEEFAGKRSGRESDCLSQKNFKYIKPLHDPINKILKNMLAIYPEESTLKIVKINSLDPDIGTYKADFSVVGTVEGDKNKQTFNDSLIFMLDNDEKWGCSMIISSPSNLFTSKRCK